MLLVDAFICANERQTSYHQTHMAKNNAGYMFANLHLSLTQNQLYAVLKMPITVIFVAWLHRTIFLITAIIMSEVSLTTFLRKMHIHKHL